MKIILHNIKVPVTSGDPENEAVETVINRLNRRGIRVAGIPTVAKRSIDARDRNSIRWIFSVIADTEKNVSKEKLGLIDAVEYRDEKIRIEIGDKKMGGRPVVVGFGPCGMFAALLLAENGYRPVVLERGGDVSARKKAVEDFYKNGILDTNCNVQFGAGGAGTFSDGKLITRINDPKCSYVLDRFVEFGAPEDIKINAKPHIGTDLLTGIVSRISDRIVSLGGEILYRTVFEKALFDSSGNVKSVLTDKGSLECGSLILAIGHSSRDTYGYLLGSGFEIIAKPFSVGVRIEHLREKIDYALYGDYAGILPPAEYTLSHKEGQRGVYSFCMCPGGNVVAAASEEGSVVTNGMSYHKRDGKNSNSALAVSVLPSDYGSSPEKAIGFQREIEKRGYFLGGSNYDAPVQTVGDFLDGKTGTLPSEAEPTYMGGGHWKTSDLRGLFPKFVSEILEIGIRDFGRKIPGFDSPNAVLTGPETRTSAPVRIVRNENRTSPSHGNIYPCGEGAGYAGGITSAAVDGINTALEIMKKFKPAD